MNTSTAAANSIATPPLTQETFNKFRRLILEKTNINMRDGKQILVANRLRKRLLKLDIASHEEYYDLLTDKSGESEMSHFIDAVSTNETYFFREENHFEALSSKILPEMFRSHGRLKIWSAGCSTGEEVYTLRIIADRAARLAGAPAPEIIGTDISTEVIQRAREGIYRERSLRHVPPEHLKSCFLQTADGSFQVSAEIRKTVDFRVHNLFTGPPPWDRAHIIFCRNVMIYFDKQTQMKLVDEIFANAIHPNGYLFIGHSESLNGMSSTFRYVPTLKSPVYRRREEAAE